MPDKKADAKDLPLGSGLLEKARRAFLNRDAQIAAAENQALREAKDADKESRKANYVP